MFLTVVKVYETTDNSFAEVPTNYRIMKRVVEFMKNNNEFDKVPTNYRIMKRVVEFMQKSSKVVEKAIVEIMQKSSKNSLRFVNS